MQRGSIVSVALAAIERSINEDHLPTVRRVAEALSTSPRTLQRRLREAGTSHRQLVQQVRLDLARRLLAETDTSVSEIGLSLGYTDPSHFGRFFVRMTGLRPLAYRRQCQAEASRTASS